MPQTDAATPTKLSSITPELSSQKLRIAGRMLAYDSSSTILLIADGDSAVLVDISLCLDPSKSLPWLSEGNTTVIALGYLESLKKPLPPPVPLTHARVTYVDLRLVLSALLVTEAPELDLDLWNHAIEEREKLGHPRHGAT